MSVISQKYIKELTTLYNLSKDGVKLEKLDTKNFLTQCDNRFISRHLPQQCVLVRRVRIMVVADVQIIRCDPKGICHKLVLVEAFFTPQIDKKNPSSSKKNPLVMHVSIESTEKLQLHDLILIRQIGKYKLNSYISKKDCLKIMQLKLNYKYALHDIIKENIDYAKICNMTKKTKGGIKTESICVILKNSDDFVVAKRLSDNSIIKLQDRQKSLKTLPDFTLVVVDRDCRVTDVLGNFLQGNHDMEISLRAANYSPAPFSREVLREAKNIALALSDIKSVPLPPMSAIKKPLDTTLRYDMTHLPFCTIDPVNAKDHDDAIYYDSKMGLLYVAIADVSSYVSFNGAIDRAAQNNAFSLYFPNKVFPMLPPNLSSNACSLKSRKKRLALVWILRLHKRTAMLLHAQVYRAVICSHVSLNYNQVTHFLENPSHPASIKRHKEVCNSLLTFSKIAQLLRKKRMKQGIDLALRDFNIEIDNDENIKSVSLKTENKSCVLVEEAMLLANQASANFLGTIGYGIYRNHSNPQKQNFNKLMSLLSKMDFRVTFLSYKNRYKSKEDMQAKERKKMLEVLRFLQKEGARRRKKHIVDSCIMRIFTKANYMIQNEGHFGLGFSCYTHFTSPIRRYSDLIVHRIITAYLQRNFDMLPAMIYKAKYVLPYINEREMQFDAIESYYKRLKMLRYAQSILPFCDEAFVVGIKGVVAYGFPLHRVGFCNVIIRNVDSIASLPIVAKIKIVSVDFYSMRLEAILIDDDCKKGKYGNKYHAISNLKGKS